MGLLDLLQRRRAAHSASTVDRYWQAVHRAAKLNGNLTDTVADKLNAELDELGASPSTFAGHVELMQQLAAAEAEAAGIDQAAAQRKLARCDEKLAESREAERKARERFALERAKLETEKEQAAVQLKTHDDAAARALRLRQQIDEARDPDRYAELTEAQRTLADAPENTRRLEYLLGKAEDDAGRTYQQYDPETRQYVQVEGSKLHGADLEKLRAQLEEAKAAEDAAKKTLAAAGWTL